MIPASLFPLGTGHYLAGGICIGLAVSLIFLFTGQVTGMSSVFTSTWSWFSRLPYFHQERFLSSRVWRLWLAAGLVLGGALHAFVYSGSGAWQTEIPLWQLVVGGFLAGFGARYGNGCTSGHGICGMASLSRPSLLAVPLFMVTAIVSANLVLLLGGA